MKNLLPILVVSALSATAFATTSRGHLNGPFISDSRPNEVRFECIIDTGEKKLITRISLDKATRFLDVILNDGNEVRGSSSETIDRKNGTTHYFLQGASAPLFQRVTLTINEDRKSASFSQVYGAEETTCNSL